MVGLGDLPGGPFTSQAIGISADGSTVVGSSFSAPGGQAFRWTSGGGMVGLGDLPGGIFLSSAWAVSADGSVVVGESGGSTSGQEAFVWNSSRGMKSLREVLVNLAVGPVLSGWTLTRAQAISDDGLTIVGFGNNPSGQREAWIAVIPEPSTSLLLGLGIAGLAVLRRHCADGR